LESILLWNQGKNVRGLNSRIAVLFLALETRLDPSLLSCHSLDKMDRGTQAVVHYDSVGRRVITRMDPGKPEAQLWLDEMGAREPSPVLE
jgi:hypothetical protein